MSQLTFQQIYPYLLRPMGDGIPTFSAAKGQAFELQKKHFKLLNKQNVSSAEEINKLWAQSFSALAKTKLVILGVPTDTGGGIRRGAAYGPQAIRTRLLENSEYQAFLKNNDVLDLGDIYVNPHLLHDEMLSKAQVALCQSQMYPGAPESLKKQLPVSVLSQLRLFLQTLLNEFSHLKIFVLGGDHSIGWPISEVLSSKHPNDLAIVQPDAHTDMLENRLGVKYCFGTWSFHANNLIGRKKRLVQLGIRQSGKPKSHWETHFDVKQFWASELTSIEQGQAIEKVMAHLKSLGTRYIYFSNDIDGTDQSLAPATGTPVPNGLSSEFLLTLIKQIGAEFEIIGADINEVAPFLGTTPEEGMKTCALAAEYTLACIKAQIRF